MRHCTERKSDVVLLLRLFQWYPERDTLVGSCMLILDMSKTLISSLNYDSLHLRLKIGGRPNSWDVYQSPVIDMHIIGTGV
jgi:hypothetical protein